MKKLSEVVGFDVKDVKSLVAAVENRVDFFHENGARLSDHALDTVFFEEYTEEEIASILEKALAGETVAAGETAKYKSFVLVELGKMYKKRDWAQQYHIGALRNNNTRMFHKMGADIGFDSINDELVARPLSKLMDTLDREDNLPKTILYNLNGRDNDVIGTMLGNFQGETNGVMKIQFGSGWWFNDQKDGMEKQMISLANLSLLRKFVGMLTDSRSFISYPRHDYFRRILCSLLGKWVEEGEVPEDYALLEQMVKEISYLNAEKYFNM